MTGSTIARSLTIGAAALANPVRQPRSSTAQVSVTSYGREVCNANDLHVSVRFAGDMGLNLGVAKLTKLTDEDITAAGPENLPGRRRA